jgi:hypothetical protein
VSGTNQIYQIAVEKALDQERWTNVYYTQVTDGAAPVAAALAIADREKEFHLQSVVFTQARIRRMPEGIEEGSVVPLNERGVRIASDHYPLFNVIRVDFRVSSGRPSRKYYRGPVDDADATRGVVNPPSLAFFQAQMDLLLSDVPTLCDVDGQLWLGAAVSSFVGMRQLKRGSKRKAPATL